MAISPKYFIIKWLSKICVLQSSTDKSPDCNMINQAVTHEEASMDNQKWYSIVEINPSCNLQLSIFSTHVYYQKTESIWTRTPDLSVSGNHADRQTYSSIRGFFFPKSFRCCCFFHPSVTFNWVGQTKHFRERKKEKHPNWVRKGREREREKQAAEKGTENCSRAREREGRGWERRLWLRK